MQVIHKVVLGRNCTTAFTGIATVMADHSTSSAATSIPYITLFCEFGTLAMHVYASCRCGVTVGNPCDIQICKMYKRMYVRTYVRKG